MKNKAAEQEDPTSAEMQSEYDFRGAGAEAYRPLHEGYEVQIHKADGTTVVQQFVLQEGTVMLEPDVQAFFPDSESVNKALRTLMTLFPASRRSTSGTAKASGAVRKVAAEVIQKQTPETPRAGVEVPMSVTITYHGHACFTIQTDKANLLIDPFLSGNAMADVTPEQVKPDYILVTHAHGDHLGDALPIAVRTGATVISNNEIHGYLAKHGAKSHGMHIGGRTFFRSARSS